MEGKYLCEGKTGEVEVKRKGKGYTVHFSDGTIAPLQWVQKTYSMKKQETPTEPEAA